MSKENKEAPAQNTEDDMVVWAHTPLKELNGQTGYVTCKESLGNKLIKEGAVQAMDEGALNFKEIQSGTQRPAETTTPTPTPPPVIPPTEKGVDDTEETKVVTEADTKTK